MILTDCANCANIISPDWSEKHLPTAKKLVAADFLLAITTFVVGILGATSVIPLPAFVAGAMTCVGGLATVTIIITFIVLCRASWKAGRENHEEFMKKHHPERREGSAL